MSKRKEMEGPSEQQKKGKGMEGPSEPQIETKTICVFGGAELGHDRIYRDKAREFGLALGARKINLIYQGGVGGLYGTVALHANISGSIVTSFSIEDPNRPPTFILGSEKKVANVAEKWFKMFHKSDAFVCLPGGLEIMEPLFILLSPVNMIFRKPVGFLNVNGYYDGVFSFFLQSPEQGFMHPSTRHFVVSSSDVNELIDQLMSLSFPPNLLIAPPVPRIQGGGNQGNEPDTELRL